VGPALSAYSSRQRVGLPAGRPASCAATAAVLATPFLVLTLLVRVLTDDLSSPTSRHSGSLNLSAAIAVLFIVLGATVLVRGGRGRQFVAPAVAWLGVWTAIALASDGFSAETLREGVREASIVALAVIVYNARGTISAPIAARTVQVVAFVPALIALYQLLTHTGMNVTGELRSNGTFAFPTSAAMFFAIAGATSLWRYLHAGAKRLDAMLLALFAAALIATFSIDGLLTLAAMLVALGLLQTGSWRAKLGPCAVAAVVLLAFFATPLGSQRISSEAHTNVATVEGGTSLAWRIHQWKLLLARWERSPLVGHGLGSTLTRTATSPRDNYTGKPPHNEYIRYLVETGILGLALLAWGAGMLARRLVQLLRSPTAPAATGAAATLGLVVLFGCLFNALADNTFINSPTCYAAALLVVASVSRLAAA
jgi:O-antigen ligase